MLSDFRFALRQFLKSPGFSIVAVLTLALAIGANVAIFSTIDAVLLHPLPYPDPDRLVIVGENLLHFNLTKIPASPPEVIDYRNMATTFAQFGAVDSNGAFTLTGDGNPEGLSGMHITASIFSMLGVTPIAGGLFTAEQEQYGKQYVAVISEGLWKRRYGSDPSLIGRNIQLNQENYRVVGVIRPILEYRFLADVWTPMAFSPKDLDQKSRGTQFIDVIGRLKPGVTLAQSQAEFRNIAARLQSQYPGFYQSNYGYSLDVDPLAEKAGGDLKRPLLVLARRGGRGDADRLRERLESPASPRHHAPQGDHRACGSRRSAIASRSPTADRKPSASRDRGHSGTASRARRPSFVRAIWPARSDPRPAAAGQRMGTRVFHTPLDWRQRRVRPRARA